MRALLLLLLAVPSFAANTQGVTLPTGPQGLPPLPVAAIPQGPVQLTLPFMHGPAMLPSAAIALPGAAASPAEKLAAVAAAAAPHLAAAADAKAGGEATTLSAEASFALLQRAGIPASAVPEGVIVTPITERIIHLHFRSHYRLANTFLRFQETYESPKFRGKVFSREVYEDWYAKTHGDRFSYAEDWGGFNIPSRVLKKFYAGQFDPLTEKERLLLDLFKDKKGRFYVIGTSGTVPDADTLRHETAHGLFYSRRDYKKEVLAVLKGLDLSSLFAFLAKDQGYHKRVWLDEAHAYLLEDWEWLKSQGVDPKGLEDAAVRLKAVYAKYAAKLALQ